MSAIDEAIEIIALRQHGRFSYNQVVSVGGTRDHVRRRLQQGRWRRVAPRVYELAGASASWHGAMMIAILDAGPEALLSHRSAGALWRLDAIEPGAVELVVPPGRRGAIRAKVHRSITLIEADHSRMGPLAVTSPTRTLVDLAGAVPYHVFERAAESAFRRGATSPGRLRWRMVQLGGQGVPGAAAVRMLMAERGRRRPTGSDLETRFEQLVIGAGLERPERQVTVRTSSGKTISADFGYPHLDTLIELEGDEFHLNSPARRRDRSRQNKIEVMGFTVLTYGDYEVRFEPDEVIADLLLAGVRRLRAAS
jgi:very-short-patch-repair endonuclease